MDSIIQKDGYCLKENKNNGPTLGFSKESGVTLKEKDGLYFKNLSRTEDLLPYEDWRLSADVRAADLASRLSVEQIAGLMLYSMHQVIPNPNPHGPMGATYDGKVFPESGKKPWELSDQQKEFLKNDGIRHVLGMVYQSAEVAAKWNNEMQRYTEALPFGIPINTCSDPRHGAGASAAEFKVNGDTSKWPEGLGMAATFDPKECYEFAKVMQAEYRAMGLTTALSPQADLATEPRWFRAVDTFGAHSGLAADMTRAYCDGLQETKDVPDQNEGWGKDSVIAMAKHWPGGGTGESGRDAHYVFGKYAVYPGNCFDDHLKPFLDGAFKLNSPTKQAGAVMPYYTVSWNIDPNEKVGNSYSHYIIHDLLREKYGYDGVVCTDWGITADEAPEVDMFGSRCYGVEHLSEAERHLKIIMNGVDQFGGNNKAQPVIEAYRIGCEKYGEEKVKQCYVNSARRLLRAIFRLGLFENPYIDAAESKALVGCDKFVNAGFAAQLKSIILLKNKAQTLPLKAPAPKKLKVYIPIRHIGKSIGFFRNEVPGYDKAPVPKSIVEKYFEQVDDPKDCDFSIVFIESPITNHYSKEDREKGGNGYLPTSLQFRPYTAAKARDPSIAGGDPLEKSANRSHKGKTVIASNENDLDNVLNTKEALDKQEKVDHKKRPLIVVCHLSRAVVPKEFEGAADGFLAHFGVQAEAVFEIILGKAEPSALLPIQLPKDMDTVEEHCEDKAFDMQPYKDSENNEYNFGYGLSWSGVIHDERNKKYSRNNK